MLTLDDVAAVCQMLLECTILLSPQRSYIGAFGTHALPTISISTLLLQQIQCHHANQCCVVNLVAQQCPTISFILGTPPVPSL